MNANPTDAEQTQEASEQAEEIAAQAGKAAEALTEDIKQTACMWNVPSSNHRTSVCNRLGRIATMILEMDAVQWL